MSDKATILRDAYQKLDGMEYSFGLPQYSDELTDTMIERYLGIDLKDTLREMGLQSVDGIEVMSNDELQVEDRVVYHALRRFRNSASVYFKFSTATDGKTVDKSMIPKMILEVIHEYDKQFKDYKMHNMGKLWNRGVSS
jgi:hypothetical protein